ncbi:EpsG family protein [Caballeronia sp. LZ035]|uniref:EpsG family protein n=1 Tax=Caballeronia sp. LZ035 TaxID=3038568 RepID=UPI0028572675|nr:EpsG family protein [Caballeronia sp. LZ035]MDR5759805.1 hypothetical protein [Caballeronia sp. LZ035]
MSKAPASMGVTRSPGEPAFFSTPAGWAFLVIAATIIWFLVTADRSIYRIPDQDAYLVYFRYTDWAWLESYFQRRGFGPSLIPRMITDEIGWRLWIIFVNAFGFTPDTGIRITVALSNGLVFWALTRLRRPLLGLALWIVIPSALAITGLFQVRQGFAFAIAMTFAFVWRRPVLGMLIASTVHTTIAFPAALLIAARLSGRNNRVAIPLVCVAAGVLAASAQILFDTFGGRRIGDYANYEAEFSINLLVLMMSYAIGSALLLISLPYVRAVRLQTTLRELSLMHFGLVVYLVFAFVLFPFGKDRVFYYISLMLPFFVQEIRIRNSITLWLTTLLYLMIAAEAYLGWQRGSYVYLFR